MHFQLNRPQGKLVRVVRGEVWREPVCEAVQRRRRRPRAGRRCLLIRAKERCVVLSEERSQIWGQ